MGVSDEHRKDNVFHVVRMVFGWDLGRNCGTGRRRWTADFLGDNYDCRCHKKTN